MLRLIITIRYIRNYKHVLNQYTVVIYCNQCIIITTQALELRGGLIVVDFCHDPLTIHPSRIFQLLF